MVRHGADADLPSAAATYSEMLLQIARDYNGLPDARTLDTREISFFYEGLRAELKRHTQPKASPAPPKRPRKR